MSLNRLGWLVWIPGTVLVVMSWTGHVSPRVGWFGFLLGLAGAFISWIPQRAAEPQPPPAPPTPLDEIAKLADLRDRGAITEDEFQRKKLDLLKKVGRDSDSPGASPY